MVPFTFACVLAFFVENVTGTKNPQSIKNHLVVAFLGSIHSIKGTWIEVDTMRYRCKYQPPFTSKIHTGDLEHVRLNAVQDFIVFN